MVKPLVGIALTVFLALFAIGAKSGWDRTRSDDAVVLAALSNTVILPADADRFRLAIFCPAADKPGLVYLQDPDSDLGVPRPAPDVVDSALRTAAGYMADARNMMSSDVATAAILGGTVSTLVTNRLTVMRAAIFAPAASRTLAQKGWVGALIVIAGFSYYLGDWIVGANPPACGSETALKPLEKVDNRRLLEALVYDSDNRQQVAVDPVPRSASQTVGAITGRSAPSPAKALERDYHSFELELATLRLNPSNADFAALRQRCWEARARTGKPVCTYL